MKKAFKVELYITGADKHQIENILTELLFGHVEYNIGNIEEIGTITYQ